MPEDYESSAIRHYEDAVELRNKGRLDNAGHLVGFAAECAIKFRIANLRPQQDAPHGHLPDLLLAARKHLGQRGGYPAMYQLLKGGVLAHWSVNRRYHATGDTSPGEVDGWLGYAKRLLWAAGIKRK